MTKKPLLSAALARLPNLSELWAGLGALVHCGAMLMVVAAPPRQDVGCTLTLTYIQAEAAVQWSRARVQTAIQEVNSRASCRWSWGSA